MKPSRTSAVRTARYAGLHTFNMAVDMSSVDAVLNELGNDIEQAVRPAAQAAAEVFYQAVLKNVDALGSVTGNLRGSIYQKFSPEKSGEGLATYHVSWRTVRGPLTYAPHGHLVEYGYIQRYEYYRDENGHVRPKPKPENHGKKPPWVLRGAKGPAKGEAQKWYQPRKGGPIQIAAHPFIRPAFYKQGEAIAAAKAKIFEILDARK